MFGIFSRTPPPFIEKQDLYIGLENNIVELSEIRISRGFKILSLCNETSNGEKDFYLNNSINAQKSYKGGYSIQIINEINRNFASCEIYFLNFTEEEVCKIMDANFSKKENNKWIINEIRHLSLKKNSNNHYYLKSSEPEKKCN